MVDIAVVFSPVGGGHKAAALAVQEAAEARGMSVALVNTFDHAPKIFGDAYLAAHLAWQGGAPELYGKAYYAANDPHGLLEPVRRRLDAAVLSGLERYVESLSPRAVIATHHLPLVSLGRARRKKRLAAPVVGVVTDYTTHACWVERGVDAFAVPYGEAGTDLIRHGVDASCIFRTGIPVKSAFERIAPPTGGPLRVLVTSGGFGVGPVVRIAKSFAGLDVELTVVCGASEKLLETLRAENLGEHVELVGFEKDMARRLANAHVVVGKAGGLTVTETLTAGRALVVAAAIPGNEAANERYVVEGGAGLGADPDAVGAVIAEAVPRLLAMGARARQLVPTGAANRVLDLALRQARAVAA